MKCKRCGAENPEAKRCCAECGAFLEGWTLNNVTGEYGYRGADGVFYRSEDEYRARSSAALSPSDEWVKMLSEPQWPAGSELVVYCRKEDRDAVSKDVERRGCRVAGIVTLDDSYLAQIIPQGEYVAALKETITWLANPHTATSAWLDNFLKGI